MFPAPANHEKRRPILVWFICALYLFSVPAALFQGLVISPRLASDSIPTNDAMQAFYGAHIVSIRLFFLVSGLLALASAVFLFKLRRAAFYLISAGFVLSLLNFLWQCLGEGLLGTMPKEAMPTFITVLVISWGLSAATVGYVGYLYFAKVLR